MASAVALVVAIQTFGCRAETAQKVIARVTADPAAVIEDFTRGLSPDTPYRDPDENESAAAQEAVRDLVADPNGIQRQGDAFRRLGFRVVNGTDVATRRPFSLFIMDGDRERGWGLVLVDRSASPRVVVEVPHPVFDINTHTLGISLHRLVPGSVLLMAGAHRAAANGAADVAHNDKSMFHVIATEFARWGTAQIQIHGYADKNLPDAQTVVSTGTGPVTDLARDIAGGFIDAGIITCQAWKDTCGRLEGTRNEQGKAAADIGAEFVHLELGWVLRRDAGARDLVAATIAGRLPGR